MNLNIYFALVLGNVIYMSQMNPKILFHNTKYSEPTTIHCWYFLKQNYLRIISGVLNI